MSARKQIDELNAKVEKLRVALAKEQKDSATHLRVIERLTIKAVRTDEAEASLSKAHADRHAAWLRVGELARQLDNVNGEVVTLANNLDASVAALSDMPDTIITMRRVIAEHIAIGLGHASTSVRMRAEVLRSEMDLAGCTVDNEVKVLRALGDAL